MMPKALSDDAPEITPQVLHLRDLLKWVRQGRIRVPNFQRDFTWDRGRMLNLFDSIRKQYPIGTLLFWESIGPRPMSPYLGPLAIPQFTGGTLLVLDGQQRLTTLSGVLLIDELAPSNLEDSDPGRWQVWYDADADSFVHVDDGEPPISAVRVAELMGTKGLYGAAQKIMGSNTASAAVRELWVNRIEAVSAALGAYRIPLVIFATESLQLAVESFTRLNRAGQKVGADEMFSALTYRAADGNERFRLSSHIDSILAEIVRMGFGEIDRVVVLRVVLLAADLDPFRTEWDTLAKETQEKSSARLPLAIEEARKGLVGAIKFLQAEEIRNTRLLPYSMQLVGLAAFFGQRNTDPTEGQVRLLRQWLWVTAFTEAFGGLNPSRILIQLKCLHDYIPKHDTPTTIEGIDLDAPAHPFPERHDQRSARVRALLCVMLRKPALRSDGTTVSADSMAKAMLERGPDALTRVCSVVAGVGATPRLVSSPANRVFDVENQVRGQAKKWLVRVSPLTGMSILESHYITESAWHALCNGEHGKFIQERIQTLMTVEREFMQEKGVMPPTSSSPALSAIDVEDEVPLSEEITNDSSEAS